MSLEFKGKYLITGKLVCETGLHIGGSTEGFQIGGVDNPVIKDPMNDQPYIPGSSLKGKLRHLLEWAQGWHGFTDESPQFTIDNKKPKGEPTYQPCSCGQCESCALFGVTPQTGVKEESKIKSTNRQRHSIQVEVEVEERGQKIKKGFFVTGPSRLTVRDAFLTGEQDTQNPKRYYSRDEMSQLLGEKDLYTEIKTENALDRVTSEANPRPMERVPAGASFDVEMIFDIYRQEDKNLLKSLFTAMHLLENSALGGSGSRGSGKVKFADIKVEFRPVDYYRIGDGIRQVERIPATLKEVIKQFDTIGWQFPTFVRKGIEPCPPTQST